MVPVSNLHLVILKCTDRCNHRCRYCGYWQCRDPRDLTISATERMLSRVDGLHPLHFLVTGGEPFLNPDIEAIIRRISGSSASIAICTNGMSPLLLAPWVSELVDEVYVSVWGVSQLTHDTARGVASHRLLCEHVRRLVQQGQPRPELVLFWTVVPENLSELPSVPHFAATTGFDRIGLQAGDARPFGFCGAPFSPWKMARISASSVCRAFSEFGRNISQAGIRLDPTRRIAHVRQYVLAALGHTDFTVAVCDAPSRSVVVEPDLSLRPCYFSASYGRVDETLRGRPLIPWADARHLSQIRPWFRECHACVCSRIYSTRDREALDVR